jgi:hypothetical protein
MIAEVQENTTHLPKPLEEFTEWKQPNVSFKYEWNDGKIIKFAEMNSKQIFIFTVLNKLFAKKGYLENGALIPESDV